MSHDHGGRGRCGDGGRAALSLRAGRVALDVLEVQLQHEQCRKHASGVPGVADKARGRGAEDEDERVVLLREVLPHHLQREVGDRELREVERHRAKSASVARPKRRAGDANANSTSARANSPRSLIAML